MRKLIVETLPVEAAAPSYLCSMHHKVTRLWQNTVQHKSLFGPPKLYLYKV
jgi:hypothetical protein